MKHFLVFWKTLVDGENAFLSKVAHNSGFPQKMVPKLLPHKKDSIRVTVLEFHHQTSQTHSDWPKSCLSDRIVERKRGRLYVFAVKLYSENGICHWLINNNNDNGHFLTIYHCMFVYGWSVLGYLVWVTCIVFLSSGFFVFSVEGDLIFLVVRPWVEFVCFAAMRQEIARLRWTLEGAERLTSSSWQS